MYPLWAMSTGRDEIEGPNGGLRMRCGLSLCALSVCLFTYLWWKSLNGYLEHHYTQQHLVLHNIMSSSTPRSTAQVRRSGRLGSRAPRATSGSKARSKSPGPQGRGARRSSAHVNTSNAMRPLVVDVATPVALGSAGPCLIISMSPSTPPMLRSPYSPRGSTLTM